MIVVRFSKKEQFFLMIILERALFLNIITN